LQLDLDPYVGCFLRFLSGIFPGFPAISFCSFLSRCYISSLYHHVFFLLGTALDYTKLGSRGTKNWLAGKIALLFYHIDLYSREPSYYSSFSCALLQTFTSLLLLLLDYVGAPGRPSGMITVCGCIGLGICLSFVMFASTCTLSILPWSFCVIRARRTDLVFPSSCRVSYLNTGCLPLIFHGTGSWTGYYNFGADGTFLPERTEDDRSYTHRLCMKKYTKILFSP